MRETELRRVQQDLEIVKQAAGLTPQFTRSEVWLHTACIPTGIMAAIWGLVMPASAHLGLIPTLLIAVGYALWLQVKPHHEVVSKVPRRDYIIAGVAVVVAVVFALWSKEQNVSGLYMRGAGIFGLGVTMAALALTQSQRLYLIGGAFSFMIAGLAIPFCDCSWVVPFGLGISSAGLLLALAQSRQLRSHETYNGTNHEKRAN